NLHRRILGKHVTGLGDLPLAREHRSGHDQGLRASPALRQAPAHQQLVCTDPHEREEEIWFTRRREVAKLAWPLTTRFSPSLNVAAPKFISSPTGCFVSLR